MTLVHNLTSPQFVHCQLPLFMSSSWLTKWAIEMFITCNSATPVFPFGNQFTLVESDYGECVEMELPREYRFCAAAVVLRVAFGRAFLPCSK